MYQGLLAWAGVGVSLISTSVLSGERPDHGTAKARGVGIEAPTHNRMVQVPLPYNLSVTRARGTQLTLHGFAPVHRMFFPLAVTHEGSITSPIVRHVLSIYVTGEVWGRVGGGGPLSSDGGPGRWTYSVSAWAGFRVLFGLI